MCVYIRIYIHRPVRNPHFHILIVQAHTNYRSPVVWLKGARHFTHGSPVHVCMCVCMHACMCVHIYNVYLYAGMNVLCMHDAYLHVYHIKHSQTQKDNDICCTL